MASLVFCAGQMCFAYSSFSSERVEEVANRLSWFSHLHFKLIVCVLELWQPVDKPSVTPVWQTRHPHALRAIKNPLFDSLLCPFHAKCIFHSKSKWFACNGTICLPLLGFGSLLSWSVVGEEMCGWTADGETESGIFWVGSRFLCWCNKAKTL